MRDPRHSLLIRTRQMRQVEPAPARKTEKKRAIGARERAPSLNDRLTIDELALDLRNAELGQSPL
jgi:hypothetical protein